jgi:hypothetical protein
MFNLTRIHVNVTVLVSTLLLAANCFGQAPASQTPRYPTQVDANYTSTHQAPHPKYLALDLLSPSIKATLNSEAEEAVAGNPSAIGAASSIVTIPVWAGSYSFDGPVQSPFVMVGNFPKVTSRTFINTQLVPISLVFDGFINPMTGTTAVINAGPIVAKTLAGPDFAHAAYTDGFVQFADAVQRAEFQFVRRTDWHTILNPPVVFPTVTIHVPASALAFNELFHLSDGKIYCLMDFNFLVGQLNSLLASEPLGARKLRIYLIRNTFLFENGKPNDCCVVGFHTAVQTAVIGSQAFVQTLSYASWVDSDVASGFFGQPGFADVVALSHEISETFNDPFVNNLVSPSWQFPNSTACQNNLEVGDPVEVLSPGLVTFPVTIGGFTYHPQNEALLQWFAQNSPSNAIDGAYSYPNESSLPSPSISCP